MEVLRIFSFPSNFNQLMADRGSRSVGIHGILECNLPLEKMHRKTSLSLILLTLVITAHCKHDLLYLPVTAYDDSSLNDVNDAKLEYILIKFFAN